MKPNHYSEKKMIITERQIIQLIQIGQNAVTLALSKGGEWDGWAHNVSALLDIISNQQSNDLIEIKPSLADLHRKE